MSAAAPGTGGHGDRQTVHLRHPPEPARLRGFPGTGVDDDVVLYRVTRRGHGPWWFASLPVDTRHGGRFDLAVPHGTCYLATDELGGWLEVVGEQLGGIVPLSFLRARTAHAVSPGESTRLADLTDPRAVGHGVTREIATVVPYALPRAWAAALHAAGFEGLRHELRHVVGEGPRGVALFAEVGVAGAGGTVDGAVVPRGPVRQTGPGDAASLLLDEADLIASLDARYGVRVAAVPTGDALLWAEAGDDP